MKILLDKSEVYNFCKPYIIAEIGANHNGDMDLARKIIDSAKACGADAVKFQSFDHKSLVSKAEYDANTKYNDSPKKHFGSLSDMVEKYYLRKEQHYELKEYCQKIGIGFSSTPFSFNEVDLLVDLDVPYIKVASMDINNYALLKYIALTGKPVILSTGMATLGEIEKAIEIIEGTGNLQIILLHCISIYPPAFEDINLRNITMLQQTFPYPVGFSDHSIGTNIPLAAIALGSCIIEKHFTLDKDLPGWDHQISANPDELKQIVEQGNQINTALGVFNRVVSEAEKAKLSKFRRSLVTTKPLPKGTIITAELFTAKRPGTGIGPHEASYVLGRTLSRDLGEDELINWEDL
ncbi:MAG: N-acetylneuraminate synthase family protein [Salinivirgaceae bacterium]